MPSGPNQHYLPRFLQKPFGIRPRRKEIWVFARDIAPEPKRLKEVGASEYFYSGPAADSERTLDDDITDTETHISRLLAAIRAQPLGAVVNSTIAAEIVNHLVPRTAHVRVNMERGLRMMAHGIQNILSDDDHIQSLMGLNEDKPNDVFRKKLSESIGEIEGVESIGVPLDLIERIAFFAAKENFATLAADELPNWRDLFSSWLETADVFARETHNKTLEKLSTSLPRLSLLEGLTWTVQSAQREGAILPDCVALAIDQSGRAVPAMFSDWKEVAAILLPVAPDKLLVGKAKKDDVVQFLNFNEEAARCSHDFFLAPVNSEYLIGLHKKLGERSTRLVEEGVSGALEPYLAMAPKPRDEGTPIFPTDLINQSSEPWQYELSLIGCGNAENVHELSNAIQGIVTSLAKALPLHRLDGITITHNYREAVTSLDRGYEGASAPDSAPEEIGQGIARTISVQRDGRWKERIILDAGAAFALLAEESDAVEWGTYILVRKLTDVAISEMIERQLPGVWMKPISDPLHGFLYPNVHPAIFSYLTSHISAGFGDSLHLATEKRELFITTLGEMKSTGLAERLEYRHHGDLDRFLGAVMPRISYTLQFAADLLGHCAASGVDPFDTDGELSAALADAGLQQWFPIFGDRLERLRMRLGRWESFDEFLALDVHVERLMWQLGMLPWDGPEGVRIEVPLATDIDKLIESTSH